MRRRRYDGVRVERDVVREDEVLCMKFIDCYVRWLMRCNMCL